MKKWRVLIVNFVIIVAVTNAQKKDNMDKPQSIKLEKATFAGGCFWCTEAIFEQLKGVTKVVSGYTGGSVKNPSYREVLTGRTGHAEAIQITYNPKVLSYTALLDVFFSTHDPTTLNRQGYDVGTQYRSVVFYHNDFQKNDARTMIKALKDSKIFKNKIVTAIEPFTVFYKAETYHQDYYSNNKTQPYCENVINPKLVKFFKKYASKLKDNVKI